MMAHKVSYEMSRMMITGKDCEEGNELKRDLK